MNDDVTGNQIVLAVDAGGAGARLDVFVADRISALSRSRAKALIQSGMVRIDGNAVQEPKRAVKVGEQVTVTLPPPEPAKPEPQTIPLDVVYEDEDLIVIDKPAGMVVHPAAGNPTGTLVNALIAHCGASLTGMGGVARPGIVHRLDKDTSGLMVVAKTDAAHQRLAAQFADHGRQGPLERGYLALTWGAPERQRGMIDAPLGRASRNREKMEVKRTGGRHAVTHYAVRERYPPPPEAAEAALVECRLETGRTHQIRVHLAEIGHPVIGDPTYGTGFATKANRLPEAVRTVVAGFPRQALHAYLLGFAHPRTEAPMRFERPPPTDMAALISAFGLLRYADLR